MSRRSAPDPWATNRHASSNEPFEDSRLAGDRALGSAGDDTAPPAGWEAHPDGWGGADDASTSAAARAGGWSSGALGATQGFTQAPVLLLWVSVGAAVLALILAAIPGGLVLWIAAWVIAALIGFGGALLFTQRDAAAQASPRYLHTPIVRWLYRAAIVVALLAVIATAVRIALVFGRMG